MSEGFKNEAEGYAASLRQQAAIPRQWGDVDDYIDTDELVAAAEFIERQQTEIEALKREDFRKRYPVTMSYLVELGAYDAKYLHG